MTNFIKNFWKDEEGATAIEYGLIAGLIAVAIIAGASAIGGGLNEMFCKLSNIVKTPSTTWADASTTCAAAPTTP
ncbi:pilus assembly protein Flp/PilA [Comamonas odontotermitis]|uniref:Pilus assembly protein Flp/PilA n=1 Tax=Comamonas odontotermitis TaxID=379895 RepID=A0ABR6RI93_9BURK|nr:Flp family type IVb pilin [Comamonas odontotermitis]MBB6578872.1 pilus assembly protein Flp/PilA [Comamonas odontotermitis]